ncbi:MAG TPA: thermonuclease family protein [Geobacteraceae bacterium]|nr:thermonuclease family protein [Geobacteraceae bacterium]
MKALILSLVMLLLTAVPTLGKEPVRIIEGLVTKVSDGDTITVLADKAKLKVRLYGIDAPELEKTSRKTGRVGKPGQPYGDEAFQALLNKVHGRPVTLEVINIDRYKRLVAIVWLGSGNINREMVRLGLAWAYREYLARPHASEYLDAEDRARKGRLGLWRQYSPLPPWEFRKQMRKR